MFFFLMLAATSTFVLATPALPSVVNGGKSSCPSRKCNGCTGRCRCVVNPECSQCYLQAEACADVFAQHGFQVNAGQADGVCATSAEYADWNIPEGSFECVPTVYGDISVVIQHENTIRIDTCKG